MQNICPNEDVKLLCVIQVQTLISLKDIRKGNFLVYWSSRMQLNEKKEKLNQTINNSANEYEMKIENFSARKN